MSVGPMPRDVVCPDCNAQIDDPCTVPTDTGRRAVAWTHVHRMESAERLAYFREGYIPQYSADLQQCVDFGRHLPQSRHVRSECPALLPLDPEPVEDFGSPYPDMRETFAREAEFDDRAREIALLLFQQWGLDYQHMGGRFAQTVQAVRYGLVEGSKK